MLIGDLASFHSRICQSAVNTQTNDPQFNNAGAIPPVSPMLGAFLNDISFSELSDADGKNLQLTNSNFVALPHVQYERRPPFTGGAISCDLHRCWACRRGRLR